MAKVYASVRSKLLSFCRRALPSRRFSGIQRGDKCQLLHTQKSTTKILDLTFCENHVVFKNIAFRRRETCSFNISNKCASKNTKITSTLTLKIQIICAFKTLRKLQLRRRKTAGLKIQQIPVHRIMRSPLIYIYRERERWEGDIDIDII